MALSVEQAKAQGLVQVTIFSRPKEDMDSQYGRVTFEQWLEKEKERRGRNGERAAIVESNGKLALFSANGGK